MLENSKIKFVFWGNDEFSVKVLEELRQARLVPVLIVASPDKPPRRGRGTASPPPAKVWAETNGIPCHQPDNLAGLVEQLKPVIPDLFIIASYGKIIPGELLTLPRRGALNIHPSLLPQYRGPSPIQSAILNDDRETGVTLILADAQTDHGPIVKKQNVKLNGQDFPELRDELATRGAQLLIEILPRWLKNKIPPRPQNHRQATYTRKISKQDGEIKLTDDPRLNHRKFRAYLPWPGIYFFAADGRRVKITDAGFKDGFFHIKKVLPAGGREMAWETFVRDAAARTE